MTTRVLLSVEQLRRKVPGGIGRSMSALLDGLVALDIGKDGEVGDGGDGRATPARAAPGISVTMLASRPPRSSGEPDPLCRWGFPVRTSRLPGPLLARGWDRGLVHAPGGFHVVHALSLAVPPLRRTRRRGGVPSPALVVTVHDMLWRQFPTSTTQRGRRWHDAALRRALLDADALVVPSEEVADQLRECGAGEQPVSVVPLGTDHLPVPDRAGTAALLAGLGVTGPYLMSAGTLEPRKNLHRLVTAYEAVRASLPEPWPLLIVGPQGWGDTGLAPRGRRAAGSRRTRAASTAPAGVVAVGLVSDEVLAGLYEGARVFAYVPLAEGYGLPPVEAMTFGVPVVASNGVPSVLLGPGDPAAALRVDPLSTDAIAEALVAAAVDEDVRSALSARGRLLTGERKWSTATRRHVELWESLR